MNIYRFLIILVILIVSKLYAASLINNSKWTAVENNNKTEIIEKLQEQVNKILPSDRQTFNLEMMNHKINFEKEVKDFVKKRDEFRDLLIDIQRKWTDETTKKNDKVKLRNKTKDDIESELAGIESEKKNIEANNNSILKEKQILQDNLSSVYFTEVVVSKILKGRKDTEEDLTSLINTSGSELIIEKTNGVEIISETLIKNNMQVSDYIQATVKGYTEVENIDRTYKLIDGNTYYYMVYKYKIYPLRPEKEDKMEKVEVKYEDKIQHFLVSMGDKTITKELEDLVPEFYKQVEKFVESIDNGASQKKVDNYINLCKDNLKSYSERIRSSERWIRDRENILTGLKRDLDIINADLVKIEERESVLKDEFNSYREKLQNHLNNEIYMVFLSRPDYADIAKSEDDVYKKIIEELFEDFETKVKSNYTKRTSEVKDYILIKDEKYEGKDDAMITHIRLMGFFKEEDKNVAGRIQYELGLGFKYKFRDKFMIEDMIIKNESKIYQDNNVKSKVIIALILVSLSYMIIYKIKRYKYLSAYSNLEIYKNISIVILTIVTLLVFLDTVIIPDYQIEKDACKMLNQKIDKKKSYNKMLDSLNNNLDSLVAIKTILTSEKDKLLIKLDDLKFKKKNINNPPSYEIIFLTTIVFYIFTIVFSYAIVIAGCIDLILWIFTRSWYFTTFLFEKLNIISIWLNNPINYSNNWFEVFLYSCYSSIFIFITIMIFIKKKRVLFTILYSLIIMTYFILIYEHAYYIEHKHFIQVFSIFLFGGILSFLTALFLFPSISNNMNRAKTSQYILIIFLDLFLIISLLLKK